MSAPPPIFPMLALGFVNRCVVRADRPLVTQIVMALSSAARLVGELAGFSQPFLCGRHSSACFSTNSPCSSSRIAPPPKYEPKLNARISEGNRTNGAILWDERTVSNRRLWRDQAKGWGSQFGGLP